MPKITLCLIYPDTKCINYLSHNDYCIPGHKIFPHQPMLKGKEGTGHLVNWRANESSQLLQETPDPSFKTLRSFVSRHNFGGIISSPMCQVTRTPLKIHF